MRSLIVRSLNYIRQTPAPEGNRIAEAVDDLLTGHNNLAHQLSTDPNGKEVIPPNIAGLQVQHLGNGNIDVAITDNAPISRAIEYHVEYSTDPSMASPRGRSLGSWRTGEFSLPNGQWYFHAYSQYPAGGKPSLPVRAQGSLVVTGSSAISLFPSQSSGTGRPGQGPAQGSGKVISR